MEFPEVNKKIDQQRRQELKRITHERAIVRGDLRKLLIDRAVVQRSDVTSGNLLERANE